MSLPPGEWIEGPADWKPQVQVGRTYDTAGPIGASVWLRFAAASGRDAAGTAARDARALADRYGTPISVAPRVGQGTFRALVIDACERRCAVTGERTLPVSEAAHIKPYSLWSRTRPRTGYCCALTCTRSSTGAT